MTALASVPRTFKNPFVLAFLGGVFFLSVLPVLQRPFLKAPPPLGSWGSWALSDARDGGATDRSLAGKVVLATFAPEACDAACDERVAGLERALDHTDDLGGRISLVVFARGASGPRLAPRTRGRLAVLSGDDPQLQAVLGPVRAAWTRFAGTDAGSTLEEWSALPAYMVVDQAGQVRGFWRDDAAGRGNAINAARLLAKYGPAP